MEISAQIPQVSSWCFHWASWCHPHESTVWGSVKDLRVVYMKIWGLFSEVLSFSVFLFLVPAPLADLSSNLWPKDYLYCFSTWVLTSPCHADRSTVYSGEKSYKHESYVYNQWGYHILRANPIPFSALVLPTLQSFQRWLFKKYILFIIKIVFYGKVRATQTILALSASELGHFIIKVWGKWHSKKNSDLPDIT